MNHIELLNLIQSYHTIFTFLVDRGLLAARRKCQCGQYMVLRENANSEDGYYWECPVRRCRKLLVTCRPTVGYLSADS